MSLMDRPAPAPSAPTFPSDFPLTRAAALDRLDAFLPRAGADYARLRNLDRGPGRHDHVSRLSPALRRRLIGEDEVARAVLARHGRTAAAKFLSEVFWRTYWKGWLEQRPSVWPQYLAAVQAARARAAADPDLAQRLARAQSGQTGIDAFDAWAVELAQTGYLHNWARMQFASIWVFTLDLPWELGADLTGRLFLDADPASNTLSWRWVAGLQTPGKAYLADPARIAAMTGGRHAPRGLARQTRIPVDSIAVPPPSPPRAEPAPDPALPSLLLLTTEDLSLDTQPALADLSCPALAHLPGDTPADRQALEDGIARARRRWPGAEDLGPLTPQALRQARAAGCRQIVTGFAPVGPVADRLARLRPLAEDAGLPLAEHLRAWDRRAWPSCRKGFFTLKDDLPRLLDALEAEG